MERNFKRDREPRASQGLKKKDSFYYSKTTGLYVSRGPLKIDARVKQAIDKVALDIIWNDEGQINYIDFDESRALLSALDSQMMSPKEYWQIYFDALEECDQEMVESLMSNKFCEWLDRVYLKGGHFIDHPKKAGKVYEGDRINRNEPLGRPGWFEPKDNIDPDGHPKKVNLFREKKSRTWKYWSPDFTTVQETPRAPIRGYVTSVGKPSFDLGIPVNAKQPMQMVRECRRKPLDQPVPAEALQKAKDLLADFLNISNGLNDREKYREFLKNSGELVRFIEEKHEIFFGSKELTIFSLRETFFNALGLACLLGVPVKEAGNKLSGIFGKVDYEKFSAFIKSSKERLDKAIISNADIIFVMGHKNPDTDTAVSSAFEAYRNHLIDGNKVCYIPVIQYERIPDEIDNIFSNLAGHLLLTNDEKYKKAVATGLVRWISVDQNREPEVQKFLVSIIDHHAVSDIAALQEIPKTLERTGSCTALIAIKILGMGLEIDKGCAKILYGATLMDTENRALHKMTVKDELIMDYLRDIAGVKSDNGYYSELMAYLLDSDDPQILFRRDYKEDWGFGFAVAKIKGGFDAEGNVQKKVLFASIKDSARKNNLEKNFPLTMAKITDYNDDNIIVNRERVYYFFNDNVTAQFKMTIEQLMERIITFNFPGTNTKRGKDYIDFWGTGTQLSRKDTAPVIEPVVSAFNQYFFSPSTGLYVDREFLTRTKDVEESSKKIGLGLSSDEENRINYITYPEAKVLAGEMGFSILSIAEYWKVLNDAKVVSDKQMVRSMQGSNFVEFWDTAVLDHTSIINHPKVLNGKIVGNRKVINIPRGNPGLIETASIDPETGFPSKVEGPSRYGDQSLWRYWEPDAELVLPTRSYIFLLNQPSFDCKFHIDDCFPNLGIRPCRKSITLPKVNVEIAGSELVVTIENEGETVTKRYK